MQGAGGARHPGGTERPGVCRARGERGAPHGCRMFIEQDPV